MKRILVSVFATLMLAAAPVRAQVPSMNLIPELQSKTPEEIEREEKAQKAYKDSLRKIPDAKTSSDPWGSVRSEAPKPAPAKPARTRTGSTSN